MDKKLWRERKATAGRLSMAFSHDVFRLCFARQSLSDVCAGLKRGAAFLAQPLCASGNTRDAFRG
jgi:hypothetical protein